MYCLRSIKEIIFYLYSTEIKCLLHFCFKYILTIYYKRTDILNLNENISSFLSTE